MADGDRAITAKVVSHIGEIDAAAWDACAGSVNPFVGHAFLSALEDSGSVSADTGWLPQHIVVEDPEGGIAAAAPLYLKGHSYGEYVFDHGWAHAYERAGGEYYPKLVCAVPFTPVPGPRLLVRPGPGAENARTALVAAMLELTRQLKISSLHVNFLPEEQWQALGRAGFLQRIGQQYHWENRGYETFDDFLSALNSRKRKAIRKERREVTDLGVTCRALTGAEIEPPHWDHFYRFYRNTSDRKWGSAYLNRSFFTLLGERLADRVVLVIAEAEDKVVAGALNLRGEDTLYGRNWGCSRRYPFLHFEACYYQAIDYAIRHGLKRVEAGAQGQHKIQRGYLPVPTYSAHWIADAGFRSAVAEYLERERAAIGEDIDDLAELSPFRKTDPGVA